MLPPLKSSRRERHFYRIDRIRSEWDLAFFGQKVTYANEVGYQKTRLFELHLLASNSRSRDQRTSLGMHSRVWDLPFPEIGPPDSFSDRLCMRQKFPPRLKNSLLGTPRKVCPGGVKIANLSSCSGRVFSAHMPIYGAIIDRWRNTRAQGSLLKNSFKNSFM